MCKWLMDNSSRNVIEKEYFSSPVYLQLFCYYKEISRNRESRSGKQTWVQKVVGIQPKRDVGEHVGPKEGTEVPIRQLNHKN